MMKLFRGIAVPEGQVDQVVADITTVRGLVEGSGRWAMVQHRPSAPDELIRRESLAIGDTRSGEGRASICATGDLEGASHYAHLHNASAENDTPILIEFDVPLATLAVDGKDFLYTVFQRGEPSVAKPWLAQAFGQAILKYVDAAWDTHDQSRRIALCDLATYDPEVIEAHHSSGLTLGGRNNLVFRSAFTVALPVPPTLVTRVWPSNNSYTPPVPDVWLTDLLRT